MLLPMRPEEPVNAIRILKPYSTKGETKSSKHGWVVSRSETIGSIVGHSMARAGSFHTSPASSDGEYTWSTL